MAKTRTTSSDGRMYGIVCFDADDQNWHLGYASNQLDIVPLDHGEDYLFAHKAISYFIRCLSEGGEHGCAI